MRFLKEKRAQGIVEYLLLVFLLALLVCSMIHVFGGTIKKECNSEKTEPSPQSKTVKQE